MYEYSYANYSGFFEEEGLQVEFTVIRGAHEAIQAMLAGEIDFSSTIGSSIRASIQGANTKVLYTYILPIMEVYARPGIDTLQDVKTIAVPSRGDSHDILTRIALQRHGLQPDIDVTFVYVGMPGTLPALMTGDVDAAIVVPNMLFQIKDIPGYKSVINFKEEFPNYPMGGLATTGTMIEKKPEVVEAVVRALYRSIVYLKQHREATLAFISEVLEVDPEMAAFQWEYLFEERHVTPHMDLEEMAFIIETEAEILGTEEADPALVADATFIETVKEEFQ
jgi:ABC-type nitrate/sulfonate/bicarbonate transport system substrate-binding protein